jgi:excinuclease ABC subunit A
MTVEEGLGFFENIPRTATRLQTLVDVGLDYVKLGQTAPLSPAATLYPKYFFYIN